MRLQLILFSLSLFFVSTLFAQPQQGQGRNVNSEEMIAKQTEDMIKNLSLSDDQAIKVKALNEKYGKKMADLFQNTTGGQEGRREKMGKLRDEKNAELKTILTSDQYEKHLEAEKKRMEEMQQRRAERQNGETPSRRGQARGQGN